MNRGALDSDENGGAARKSDPDMNGPMGRPGMDSDDHPNDVGQFIIGRLAFHRPGAEDQLKSNEPKLGITGRGMTGRVLAGRAGVGWVAVGRAGVGRVVVGRATFGRLGVLTGRAAAGREEEGRFDAGRAVVAFVGRPVFGRPTAGREEPEPGRTEPDEGRPATRGSEISGARGGVTVTLRPPEGWAACTWFSTQRSTPLLAKSWVISEETRERYPS